MKAVIDIVLIVGFIATDFFFFHDAFKASESITVVEWLVGALSIIVIIRSLSALFGTRA